MSEAPSEGVLVDGQGQEVTVEQAIESKESLKAEVERPEWLPERFKSPEELAKSYAELEKVLKEKGKVAPDEYIIDDEEAIVLNKEDPLYSQFVEVAKEANLNNAQFNAIAKLAAESGLLDVPDFETEMKALGAEKDEIIGQLKNFASTRLNEKERDVLENLVLTADAAKVIYKIVRMSDKSVPARAGESASSKADLDRQLQKLMSNPNIRTDQALKQQAIELSERLASMD